MLNPNAQIGLAPRRSCVRRVSDRELRDSRLQQHLMIPRFDRLGQRSYNREFGASVQRELLPRVGLEVGYYRRWFGNQIVTINRALDGVSAVALPRITRGASIGSTTPSSWIRGCQMAAAIRWWAFRT